MVDTLWENCPIGCLAVPLNIRCSRKWASPDLPGVSSADPTLYQIICVTTGVRWSGMTTSSSPLARVKWLTSGPLWATLVVGAAAAATRRAAKAATLAFSTDCSLSTPGDGWDAPSRLRMEHGGRPGALIAPAGSARGGRSTVSPHRAARSCDIALTSRTGNVDGRDIPVIRSPHEHASR